MTGESHLDALAGGGNGADENPPGVSLRLPDIFEQVPSPFGAPEEAERWERYLDQAMPSPDDAPDLPREEIKRQLTDLRRAEAAQGVIGSAVCCIEGDERPSLAYLTVTLAASRHDDPLVAAEGLYRTELDKAPRRMSPC